MAHFLHIPAIEVEPIPIDFFFDNFNYSRVACSTRQLEDTAADCLIVRRSSDSATQSIGFVNGSLDISSMETFVGGGNDGFVTTWYGQGLSASDYTQTTTSRQPKIVDSGSTTISNGKPALLFDGTDDVLTAANEWVDEYSAHCVYQLTATSSNDSLFGNWGNRGAVIQFQVDLDLVLNFRGVLLVTATGSTDGNPSILNVLIDSGAGNKTMHYRGDQILNTTNGAMTTNATTGSAIGGFTNSPTDAAVQPINALISEMIIYEFYRPSERSDVETHQNTYWGVF